MGGDEIRFYQGVNYTLLQSREVDTLIELTLSVTSDGGYDNHATQPLYLFVMNNSGTATAQPSQSLIKIYGFSVTNGSPKHSFVPCYRKSDNAIGMYDIETDSFFVNSGTGAFIKGGNVTNNVWHDTPHYIHNTSTDTITTLPADIYANDTSVTVGLKGQMEQSGTPSPTTPIQPQECGDLETEGTKAGQYKLPISSANTTTPVYLGEVQATRKIGKLVLTGEEGWTRTANQRCYYINLEKGCPNDYLKSNIITVICSHYAGQKNTSSGSNEVNKGCVCFYTSGGYELYIGERTITSATDFKTYLQQQYANGTPVTIWYVLAEPTTGIVNEPLRKIGYYADEVSGITIPTIAGANTLSVGTTLQPSEVTVNYKGWHPVQSVHERENGAWD